MDKSKNLIQAKNIVCFAAEISAKFRNYISPRFHGTGEGNSEKQEAEAERSSYVQTPIVNDPTFSQKHSNKNC
jgi:hypothetical protein